MQKAFEYIEKNAMIDAADKVVVGVSGGADSLCLLFVLMEYQKSVPFSILAVHVEHGVRGEESHQDAKYVEALCREYQIPFVCRHFDVPRIAAEQKLSVEEAGRRVRYEAFEAAAKEWGGTKIAVAHNRNDQAETMLLHMARGSGLTGAGGIRPVRGNIIRPLLSCSRPEIEDYLKKKGISWRTDRTNEETEYTRNAIRHHILPMMEQEINAGVVEHLCCLGEDIQKTERFLEKTAEKALESIAFFEHENVRIIAKPFWEEEEVIKERMIRQCLMHIGCGLKDLKREHQTGILSLFEGTSGRTIVLPGGWRAVREFEEVRIYKEEKRDGKEKTSDGTKLLLPGQIKIGETILDAGVFPYKKENIPQKSYTKWLNYDKISNDLWLRTRQPGDYLVINREGGRKKLKDYFIEKKIPSGKRDQVLLIASGSEILWVIGYRISEAYKVTEDTKMVLKLEIKGKDTGGIKHGRENQGTSF